MCIRYACMDIPIYITLRWRRMGDEHVDEDGVC